MRLHQFIQSGGYNLGQAYLQGAFISPPLNTDEHEWGRGRGACHSALNGTRLSADVNIRCSFEQR